MVGDRAVACSRRPRVSCSWGSIPKVYRATTTILVTSQSVAHEGRAAAASRCRVEERLRSLKLQIFSRSYLEPIVREFEMVHADAGEAEIEAAPPEAPRSNHSRARYAEFLLVPNLRRRRRSESGGRHRQPARGRVHREELADTHLAGDRNARGHGELGTEVPPRAGEARRRDLEIQEAKPSTNCRISSRPTSSFLFHARNNVAQV